MQHFRTYAVPAELRVHMRAGHQNRPVTRQQRVVDPLRLKHFPSQQRVESSAPAWIMQQQTHWSKGSLAGLNAREGVTLPAGGAGSPVAMNVPDSGEVLEQFSLD